jgi:Tfp pilus assembly protein PilE
MKLQGLKAQRGITLIGFIIVMIVVGIFLFIGMKLFPVYAEYYSAITDMKAACQESDAVNADLQAMRNKLDRRFNISYVDSIDTRKHIKIIREGDKKILNVAYEVRKPLIYNIDFVAKFDHSEPMTGGKGIE